MNTEIAADAERRRANNGELTAVLGVDRYNQFVAQYDVSLTGGGAAAGTAASAVPAMDPAPRACQAGQRSVCVAHACTH